MASTASLFSAARVGKLALSHRVTMSAMTRLRNAPDTEAPTAVNVLYYTQRTSFGGLIVTEGIQPVAMGKGYLRGGALYTPAHVEGWREVTKAVHAKGGYIFAQIMHAGRVSHSSLLPDSQLPVAPSAIAMQGVVRTPTGKQPFETPRALETSEIPEVIQGIVQACQRAIDAGFDGVELHGGNGYLIQEFLAEPTNKRTDQYGGSVVNRCRFVLELIDAVAEAIGSGRVAIKFQQGITFSDIVETEEDSKAQLEYLGPELGRRQLAYVCLSSLNSAPYCFAVGLKEPNFKDDIFRFFRPRFSGTLMINGGLAPDVAAKYVEEGTADLASFGMLFLANANLPRLIQANKELSLAGADTKTWYMLPGNSEEKFYTDWPLVEVE